MRVILSIILLQALLASCKQEVENKPVVKTNKTAMIKESHDILFYNVENLFDTFDDPYTHDDDFLPNSRKQWDEERFQTKIEKLGEVVLAVNSKGPLFIGLVEVENSYVINQLLQSRGLNNINYNYAHFESPDERGIDVALVYDEDYFTVQSKEPLPVHLDKNDKTRDILYVKGIVSGESNPFHIFVNHWPSRREGVEKSEPKRILAATTLRDKIDEIQNEDADAKIIVMGDFNDYPNNNSIKKSLKAKNSHSISNDELFNLAARLDEDDQGSYNYRGDWGMVDQMMVSKSLLTKKIGKYSIKQKGLKIFNEDFVMYFDKRYNESKPNKTYGGDNYYGGYSDHLPIYIKLYRHN